MSNLQFISGGKAEFRKRILRLVSHFFTPRYDPFLNYFLKNRKYGLFLFHYFTEMPLVFLDCIGMPEWFGWMQSLFKSKARPLHDYELKLAHEVFQHKIDFSKVKIDDESRVGTHGGKYAFVTYNYINCIGTMSLPIVIHELVHVVQFQQDGSRYAIRNLIAHLNTPTYDYGGLRKIREILDDPASVHSLNYEQKADVFSDYCRLLLGQRPEWGNAQLSDAIYYYKVIKLMLY